MTQKLSLIAIAFMAISMQLSAQFNRGTGTVDSPYEIGNATQLNEVRNNLKAHYKLVADIDLKDYLSETGAGYNDGKGWKPIGRFVREELEGSFDGNGHKILNLYINRSEEPCIGLFASVTSSGEIKNLTVELAASENQTGITGGSFVGALAGYNYGKITSCSVSGMLTAKGYFGGLIGCNCGVMTSCSFSGTLTGTDKHIGGLVGTNEMVITNCYAEGMVTAAGEEAIAGGLVGTNVIGGVITASFAGAEIVASENKAKVGGLVGESRGEISSCYSTGLVTAKGIDSHVGGLIGSLNGALTNSFSISSVSGNANAYLGGLIGLLWKQANPAPLSACFYYKNEETNNGLWGIAMTVISQDQLPSVADDTPGVTPLNGSQMTAQVSFPEWDFQNVWTIGEGQTAPYFLWQLEPYPVPTPIKENETTVYHTITLKLDSVIQCNYTAGQLVIAEGDHLYLQFQPVDATRTAADMILLIDGMETAFNIFIGGRNGSYILNPIEGDHTIEIRLREELIDPNNPTGTHTPEAAIRIFTTAGRLTIEVPTRMSATVYTLIGQLVRRQMIQDTATFALPNGIYVVCVGETTYKISVGE